MPTKRPKLVNGEIYHIVMRGTDGRNIFIDADDYLHFLHDLYEFNNENVVPWEFRKSNFTGTLPGELEIQLKKDRNKIVEILAFCLMPNHFHLLLRQEKNCGISNFMRKLGGYATYFNNKHKRQGHLYQGRFKAIHIETDGQLKNVFVYIHTNPISLIEPSWKESGTKNPQKAVNFLEDYKWSSHQDYIEIKNYPSLINKELFTSSLISEENCRTYVKDWIFNKNEVGALKGVALE